MDINGERVRSGKHRLSRSGYTRPLSVSGVGGCELVWYIGADAAEMLVLDEVVVDAVVDVFEVGP